MLPIVEQGERRHISRFSGVHHGCGHDGHTAILLGAARHLARTRRFDGCVYFIFQPAEEGRGGAKVMIQDGLFDRFPCDSIYAMHNWPELPLGAARTRPGPIMAAADRFDIVVRGRGGHAAQPQRTPDAILAASELVSQLHTIISRRISATDSAVLTVTRISGGQSHNVLPSAVELTGTVRSLDAGVQDAIEQAIRQVALGVAQASGTDIEVDYSSEDFAFMLRERPGAYLWLGQGRKPEQQDAPLHHPAYDFNDEALAFGISWFVAVAQAALPQHS